MPSFNIKGVGLLVHLMVIFPVIRHSTTEFALEIKFCYQAQLKNNNNPPHAIFSLLLLFTSSYKSWAVS